MNGRPIEGGDVVKKKGINYVFIEAYGFNQCRVINMNGMLEVINLPITIVRRYKKRQKCKNSF